MGLPNAKMRIKGDNVTFEEQVDKTQYLLSELTRAALRDVGKLIIKKLKTEFFSLFPKKTGSTFAKSKDRGNIGYWVRKQESDLLVGLNVAGKFDDVAYWFFWQELGGENHTKHGLLKKTAEENIDTIREIEAQYLSAIDDERKAESLIDEEEYEYDE